MINWSCVSSSCYWHYSSTAVLLNKCVYQCSTSPSLHWDYIVRRELYSSQPVSIIEGNMSTCEQDSTYTVYNNCHLRVFYTLPPPPPSSAPTSLSPYLLFNSCKVILDNIIASQISTAYSSLYFVMNVSSSAIIYVISSPFRRVSSAFVYKSFNSLHSRSTLLSISEREGRERERERERERKEM